MNANPWLVIQRAILTPIAASFSNPPEVSTQAPVNPACRTATTPNDAAMHVEAVGPQIQDRIADELTRTVEGHVSASARFKKLDTVSFERLRSREHVRAIVTGPDSERDDRRVLEQEELIGNPVGLPFLDELLLEFQRLGVSDDPKPTNFDGPRWPRG